VPYERKPFTCTNSARIGDQADVGGFKYNLQNSFQKSFLSIYEFVADQSIVGANSTFYFQPTVGTTSIDIDLMHGILLDAMGAIIPTSSSTTSPGNPLNGFSNSPPCGILILNWMFVMIRMHFLLDLDLIIVAACRRIQIIL